MPMCYVGSSAQLTWSPWKERELRTSRGSAQQPRDRVRQPWRKSVKSGWLVDQRLRDSCRVETRLFKHHEVIKLPYILNLREYLAEYRIVILFGYIFLVFVRLVNTSPRFAIHLLWACHMWILIPYPLILSWRFSHSAPSGGPASFN